MDPTTRTRPAPPSATETAPIADELFGVEGATPAEDAPADEGPSTLAERAPSSLEQPTQPPNSEHLAPERPSTGGAPQKDPIRTGPLVLLLAGAGVLIAGLTLLWVVARSPALAIVLFWLLLLLAPLALVLTVLCWPYIVRRQQVVDRWDQMITGGRGHADAVLSDTLTMLSAMNLPQLNQHQAQYAPGILRSLAGHRRPYLVISQTANVNLRSYRMYINVRDYGENLQTSWYLTYQPDIVERLRMLLLRNRSSLVLDLFDEQDLRAYVVAVHRCFVSSVIELLTTLGQDTTKLNRTSRGFLGIS